MISPRFSSVLPTVLVIAFLLLTLAVRVYRLDWIQFDSDFGRDSLFAWRILTEKFTLLGAQASVGGFYLGPFYFYALAVLYGVVGPVPEAAMLAFAGLNVLAAWLGYRFLRTRVSDTAGLIFLMLFSTHTLLVVSSRSATHAPMLPFLTVASLIMLARSLEKPSAIRHLLSGLTLGLFLHVHFSALLLYPGYFLVIAGGVPGSWRTRLQALLLHGLGVLLMLTPLILFDLRHNFITSRAFFSYLSSIVQGESVRTGFPHWSVTEKIYNFFLYLGPNIWLQRIVLLVSGVGLFLSLKEKNSTSKKLLLMFTFLTTSLLILLLLYPSYLFRYYLVVPGTALVFTFSSLLGQARLSWVGLALASIVCVIQFHDLTRLYGPVYRLMGSLTKVTAAIEADLLTSNQPPFTVYKDSSDRLSGLGYEYRFLLARDGFVPVSEYDYSQAEVLYVIREEGSTDPLTLGGYEMGQFQPTKARLVQKLMLSQREISIFALSR